MTSRSTSLLQMESKVLLKKLRNLSVSLRRGPRRFGTRLWGLDWLKLALRCSRTLIQTSSEQQQLHEKLWGYLLNRRFWKRKSDRCLARLQYLIYSCRLQGPVRHHLYCWTFKMMIQITRLQFHKSVSSLQFHFFFFCHFTFLVHFRCVRKIAKRDYLLRRVYLSICPSARPHGTTRFPLNGSSWNLKSVFRKSVTKIQVSLIPDNNNGYFTIRPTKIYDNISLNSSSNEKRFRQKL
jgi:hypothetical protein